MNVFYAVWCLFYYVGAIISGFLGCFGIMLYQDNTTLGVVGTLGIIIYARRVQCNGVPRIDWNRFVGRNRHDGHPAEDQPQGDAANLPEVAPVGSRGEGAGERFIILSDGSKIMEKQVQDLIIQQRVALNLAKEQLNKAEKRYDECLARSQNKQDTLEAELNTCRRTIYRRQELLGLLGINDWTLGYINKVRHLKANGTTFMFVQADSHNLAT